MRNRVYRHPRRPDVLLLDVQADLLGHLRTRVVVPLFPIGRLSRAIDRLNPQLMIDGAPYVMATELLASVEINQELGAEVADLDAHHDKILAALDFLLTGV